MPEYSDRSVEKREVAKSVPVNLYTLGGTWVSEKTGERLAGKGLLGDAELYALEQSVGLYNNLDPINIQQGERALVGMVYDLMKQANGQITDIGEYFANISVYGERPTSLIRGAVRRLFDGQSSNLRPSLTSSIVTILIEQAIREPHKPILGLTGTDFGPEGLLPLLDVLIFDTKLPPFIFTGATYPSGDWESNFGNNLLSLAKVARTHVANRMAEGNWPNADHIALTTGKFANEEGSRYQLLSGLEPNLSGSFWVFNDEIFSGSSVIKVDPDPSIRGSKKLNMFISPQHHVIGLKERWMGKGFNADPIFVEPEMVDPEKAYSAPDDTHITTKLSALGLFDALNSVEIVDLGNDDPIWRQIKIITEPTQKAVIIAAHGLGNVNNGIKAACLEALRLGKTVMVISRAIAGAVMPSDTQFLIDVNNDLGENDNRVLSGYRLNKASAKSLLARAQMEGLDQFETQLLIDTYSDHRNLFSLRPGFF